MKEPVMVFDPAKLYEFDQIRKTYLLNISIRTYSDLYNKWDYSPFKKRDINENLIKYVEDCSSEMLLRYRVSIHLYVSNDKDNEKQKSEATAALRGYFKYLLFKKISELKKYLKDARQYGLIGLILLSLAYFIQKIGGDKYIFLILPEGLFIGGWVLFWEVCSILFFKYRELNQKIKEYKRLSEADISFHFIKTMTPGLVLHPMKRDQLTTLRK